MSVSADTRITTDRGLLKAVDLVGNEHAQILTNTTVLNLGTRYCAPIKGAKVVPSESNFGKNMTIANVYRLQTKEGFYIDATADHRLINKNFVPKYLKDLQIGEIVQISCSPGGFGSYGSPRIGSESARTIKTDKGIPEAVFSGNFYMMASFLIALYRGKNSLLSANKSYLQDIQLLLSNYGIYSKVTDPYENIAVFEDIIYPYALSIRPCDKMKLRKNRREFKGDKFTNHKIKHYEAHIESITPLGAMPVYEVICNGLYTAIYNGIIGQ